MKFSFDQKESFEYKYAPILALSPSEMTAIEELPGKDKDFILPVISIKGWVNSKKLKNSLIRIKKAIDDRYWVAHLDLDFLSKNKTFQITGKYPRDVFYEIKDLFKPENGYDNWYNFVLSIPEAIPVLQLYDLEQLELQLKKMESLGRGVVIILTLSDLESGKSNIVIDILEANKSTNVFIIYDLGNIEKKHLDYTDGISKIINNNNSRIPNALVSISGSSFPSSFGGYTHGENSIYERMLFNKISQDMFHINMIYSDRGSARAEKQNGGGGIPSPRIDYPLKNEWQFIRREFRDFGSPLEGEKEELYIIIAKEILNSDFWISELHLWGTQMIELTSKGDKYGINSPQRSTAVRINIHMYNQLHYDDYIQDIDTDEDWED